MFSTNDTDRRDGEWTKAQRNISLPLNLSGEISAKVATDLSVPSGLHIGNSVGVLGL